MPGPEQDKPGDFSISVFGRFTYTLSALNGHYLCPLRADRAFANSRTPDIGKASGLILLQTHLRCWVNSF